MMLYKLFVDEIPKNLTLAIGNFDGVHIAHQHIIKTCVESDSDNATVMTFSPHPREFFTGNQEKIITFEEKLELFKALGVRNVIVIEFNKVFSEILANEFIQDILVNKLNVKKVLTGYNFQFGKNREGDTKLLAKAPFDFQEIEKVTFNYHDVSSSYIIKLLKMGAINIVNSLLGRSYKISGVANAIEPEAHLFQKFFKTKLVSEQNLIVNGSYIAEVNGEKMLLLKINHDYYVSADVKDMTVEPLALIRPNSLGLEYTERDLQIEANTFAYLKDQAVQRQL